MGLRMFRHASLLHVRGIDTISYLIPSVLFLCFLNVGLRWLVQWRRFYLLACLPSTFGQVYLSICLTGKLPVAQRSSYTVFLSRSVMRVVSFAI